MPHYYNPNPYTVNLIGPDNRITPIASKARMELPDHFDRYARTGVLQRVSPGVRLNTQLQSSIQAREARQRALVETRKVARTRQPVRSQPARVVGRSLNSDATDALKQAIGRCSYPISDGIGVGILSYNRSGSLRRLLDSIRRYTRLNRTTVFVSDDCSTDPATVRYLDELQQDPDLVLLRNPVRLGVAGNTNRLLRCLSRFDHLLVLNDDVEVLSSGWEQFYPQRAAATGLQHLLFHQPGVYGAATPCALADGLLSVPERPQGAVLYLTRECLGRAGYFDESYGLYGMEHVDFSTRVGELGLQRSGFYDAAGSDRYYRVHAEASAVQGRSELLAAGRQRFQRRVPGPVQPSAASDVPLVNYVIPFRNTGRTGAVRTVVRNVIAQRYPAVRVILVEQDARSRVDRADLPACEWLLAPADRPLFNKALAFNLGVQQCSGMVVLHDADTLAPGDYTAGVSASIGDAGHLGGRVIYADQASSASIERTGEIDQGVCCDRLVGYFEGGSLACTTGAYWRAGGFNEDFWGYGSEDCDFYYRLSRTSNWVEDRRYDFLHLWHARVPGWEQHHEANKQLELSLRALPFDHYLAQQVDKVATYTR